MENQQVIEKNRKSPTAKQGRSRKKRSLAEFLKDTDFKPAVLIGKCIEQFGAGSVLGFLLGGLSVFGYAVYTPLPYPAKTVTVPAPPAPTPQAPKMVQLHGKVRDLMGNPINQSFSVGILAKQLGPVSNADGAFTLEVPASSSYDLALWNSDKMQTYTGFAAEQDGAGYRLQQALPFQLPERPVATLKPTPSQSPAEIAEANHPR